MNFHRDHLLLSITVTNLGPSFQCALRFLDALPLLIKFRCFSELLCSLSLCCSFKILVSDYRSWRKAFLVISSRILRRFCRQLGFASFAWNIFHISFVLHILCCDVSFEDLSFSLGHRLRSSLSSDSSILVLWFTRSSRFCSCNDLLHHHVLILISLSISCLYHSFHMLVCERGRSRGWHLVHLFFLILAHINQNVLASFSSYCQLCSFERHGLHLDRETWFEVVCWRMGSKISKASSCICSHYGTGSMHWFTAH